MSDKLSLNEDEMRAIVSVMRGMRLFSKHYTIEALFDYLVKEEIANRTDGKIKWDEPMLKLFKSIEDKFKNRLSEHGL
jgi:hypothetical protein